jgi:hypothetical protein
MRCRPLSVCARVQVGLLTKAAPGCLVFLFSVWRYTKVPSRCQASKQIAGIYAGSWNGEVVCCVGKPGRELNQMDGLSHGKGK